MPAERRAKKGPAFAGSSQLAFRRRRSARPAGGVPSPPPPTFHVVAQPARKQGCMTRRCWRRGIFLSHAGCWSPSRPAPGHARRARPPGARPLYGRRAAQPARAPLRHAMRAQVSACSERQQPKSLSPRGQKSEARRPARRAALPRATASPPATASIAGIARHAHSDITKVSPASKSVAIGRARIGERAHGESRQRSRRSKFAVSGGKQTLVHDRLSQQRIGLFLPSANMKCRRITGERSAHCFPAGFRRENYRPAMRAAQSSRRHHVVSITSGLQLVNVPSHYGEARLDQQAAHQHISTGGIGHRAGRR